MILKVGLACNFVLAVKSFWTILISYYCFLEVLDFDQVQIYIDFGVRWTRIERIVQKVDNYIHKASFIAIYVLKVPLLVFSYLRQDESDVFL